MIPVCHDHQVPDLFTIALIHVLLKRAESLDPYFPSTFVNVVDDIVGKGGQHSLQIMAIESIEIGAEKGLGFRHNDEVNLNLDEQDPGRR